MHCITDIKSYNINTVYNQFMEIMMITSSLDCLLRIHPSVSQAMAENKPVVALESTIITHGMPYPHNLRCQK